MPSPREGPLPSFCAPTGSPFSWLHDTAETIRDRMLVNGAVLVRGLPLDGPNSLVEARTALGITIHTPVEAFNQRNDFGNGIVSPIGWPDERNICPFQEGSFSRAFPSVVLTACITAPDGDGQAHLSDTRRIAAHLPATLADRIRTDGWTMTRVFHDGFGISWREAFGVADRAELDRLLATAGIESHWLPNGTLRTVRHRPGVIEHPATGDECWFNQISFLNAGSLEPAERAIMTKAFGQDIPMDTFFGDGSPLSEEDLAAIQHAYDSVKIGVPWRSGDLLITDNILTAQGRSSFAGSPEFLLALGEEFSPGSVRRR
ncbi:TauD/TfdA family dioxygenase [Streptomyces sp. WM6372]|uniref:TauD/TfdA family dioxygenase n=1 Tax=Streptomyces sp. WM6372 TaxID=1415555 RepID=UPI0006AF429A|nr:TauD/TfdA family dioxygenase [Streptomyces sp. WM6372]